MPAATDQFVFPLEGSPGFDPSPGRPLGASGLGPMIVTAERERNRSKTDDLRGKGVFEPLASPMAGSVGAGAGGESNPANISLNSVSLTAR
jgi:hypothetical protein